MPYPTPPPDISVGSDWLNQGLFTFMKLANRSTDPFEATVQLFRACFTAAQLDCVDLSGRTSRSRREIIVIVMGWSRDSDGDGGGDKG